MKRVLPLAILPLCACLINVADAESTAARLRHGVAGGESGRLVIRGFNPLRAGDAMTQARKFEAAIPLLKSLGAATHELTIRWNLCEPKEGIFDWSACDRFVAIYKRHGIKWIPRLVVGPANSLPDWYYKKAGAQGFVCLEHHKESGAQSLWNPILRWYAARYIQAFCEHYRDSGVVDSISLGISGDGGEATYPGVGEIGKGRAAEIHGRYHAHPGFWAGDKHAEASFQLWLGRKYGGSDRLRDAWGARASTLVSASPFLRSDAANERAWLDMCDWYIDSLTEWARFWLSTTRKHFPNGAITLCLGGNGSLEEGADCGELCKTAAEFGGSVQIDSAGGGYIAGFIATRWAASAARHYGIDIALREAGSLDAGEANAQIYNAASSDARGLLLRFDAAVPSSAMKAALTRWSVELVKYKPVNEIAVYYPQTWIKLTGRSMLDSLEPLRDRFDFTCMSDGQIRDGGLNRVKALILLEGNISEERTWEAIVEWVRRGGLLVYSPAMGELKTVEGDARFHALLFGPQASAGKGRIVTAPSGRADSYRDLLCRYLATAPELSAATRAMVASDGKEDGVFVTACAPGGLLWLNTTKRVQKRAGISIPPNGIVLQSLSRQPP